MVTIGDREMVNFGSVPTWDWNTTPATEGAVQGVQNFGTQFSPRKPTRAGPLRNRGTQTREHVRCRYWCLLRRPGPLGHPAGDHEDDDAVILDMQVHYSIQMTAQMLKARGLDGGDPPQRHGQPGKEDPRVEGKHKDLVFRGWGIFYVRRLASFADLQRLLDKHPQFHLYIDDAHGASWAGKHGVGVVREHMEHHDRMVLAVSLNKSFAAAGGCWSFPMKRCTKK